MGTMNATLAKSSKKSSGVKYSGKPQSKAAALPKAKPEVKSGVKSALKTVAGKLVKAVKSVLKPRAKAANPDKPTIKGDSRPAAKSVAKPIGKNASGKTLAKGGGKAGDVKNTAPTAAKKTPKAGEKSKKSDPQENRITMSGERAGTNVPAAEATDKIEKTVVPKVSEVATKTSKSTPAVPSDGTQLTEAQIIKMSDKDYMNPAQLAFFKTRLQQLEKDLLKNAGETTEHLRETVLVPDPADRATIEEEHALELRTRDRERKLLKKVQQSIASIDSGEYGWCEETGEPIGVPRLLARPTATLSLEAQQRRELKQKLYGD
jgi:DnaK suppressor protein